MPRKRSPLSESHPEILKYYMGNVDPLETRAPGDFSIKARLQCWWWCGRLEHRWFPEKPGVFEKRFVCPECRAEENAKKKRLNEIPISQIPEIVAGWRDPRAMDGLYLRDIRFGHSVTTYDIRCPSGHKVGKSVDSFVDSGCMYCRGIESRNSRIIRPLREGDPELFSTLDRLKNENVDEIAENHRGRLWWKSYHCCGFEWEDTISGRGGGLNWTSRRGGSLCPQCGDTFGSLAWIDPELAGEWHECNSASAWHVRPFSDIGPVWWRCSKDPTHEFQASLVERSSGKKCPFCSTAGTSGVEKEFLRAFEAKFPEAAPARIGRWRVDIFVPELSLVVEYDGEYWHKDKSAVDERKTMSLVGSGFLVARIRERRLAWLEVSSEMVFQASYNPIFGDKGAVVEEVCSWAKSVRTIV